MLTKESIKEYKKIFTDNCEVDLTDSEAQRSAELLVGLYEAVFKNVNNNYEKENYKPD